MKPILKIKNSELSLRLDLNYNNVYSRLQMLLGNKASLFADIDQRAKNTTWYVSDDEEYTPLNEVPVDEENAIMQAFAKEISSVRRLLEQSDELSKFVDDILEVPDNSFVFYRKVEEGYKFVLAAWGCKYAHQNVTDPAGSFIKRMTKPSDATNGANDINATSHDVKEPIVDIPTDTGNNSIPTETGVNKNNSTSQTETTEEPVINKENNNFGQTVNKEQTDSNEQQNNAGQTSIGNSEKKEEEKQPKKILQHVVLHVIDQNDKPVPGELVNVSYEGRTSQLVTNDDGVAIIGELPYGDTFAVSFPDIPGVKERLFEVEPKVEDYDAVVKKLVKYSPVLFIEDQNDQTVQDYSVKVVINGQDTTFNSEGDGMIQLPTMVDGQKFVVIDSSNYANTEEYRVTSETAKSAFVFHIRRAETSKVGITVVNNVDKPIEGVSLEMTVGDAPLQQTTGKDGRAEFPAQYFVPGNILVTLRRHGKDNLTSNLDYRPDISEYSIRILDGKPIRPHHKFDWKWLALLPLLILLCLGGYWAYKHFSEASNWNEMKKGVVLVKMGMVYKVSTGLDDDDSEFAEFYFKYEHTSKGERIEGSFNPADASKYVEGAYGTGFFISSDGLIATNRHVADPIPPTDLVVQLLKKYFVQQQEAYRDTANMLSDAYNKNNPLRIQIPGLGSQHDQIQKVMEYYRKMAEKYDRIIKQCTFKVESIKKIYVAFDNSIVDPENWNDAAFVECDLKNSGDPGTVDANDVAIIQLKKKENDMPKDAYIFHIPDKDPIGDKDMGDERFYVLGYNWGPSLANPKEGLHPQRMEAVITGAYNDKYRIQYQSGVINGSSGAPVLDKNGKLVAVNNSGVHTTEGMTTICYGIRTPWLKQLYDDIVSGQNKEEK